jgi:hypothetical protein
MAEPRFLFIKYSNRGIPGQVGIFESNNHGFLSKTCCIVAPKFKTGIRHKQMKENRKGKFVTPPLQIHSAAYGHLGILNRESNVKAGVQRMLDEFGGESLVIAGIDELEPDFLFNYFDDPVSNSVYYFYDITMH